MAKPASTCCTKPSGNPLAVRLGDGRIIMHYPVGPMGGEVWPFVDLDTGEVHWIECIVVTDDDGVPILLVPTESFQRFVHTAAYIGIKGSTLYAWTPYLSSPEKRGARLIFRTSTLVNEDIPQLENKLPRRESIAAERTARLRGGEVLRAGRHMAGCLRTHEGRPCIGRPRPNDPRRILRSLGKKPKK